MNIVTIKKDDILILKVGAGNCPKNVADERCEEIKKKFESMFENKLIIVATTDTDSGLEVSVMRKEY